MALSLLGVRLTEITFGTHMFSAARLLAIVGYHVASLAVFSSLAADTVRSPEDSVTDLIIEHLDLEQELLAGWLFFVGRIVYVAGMVYHWIASGFAPLPFLNLNIVAFTATSWGSRTCSRRSF